MLSTINGNLALTSSDSGYSSDPDSTGTSIHDRTHSIPKAEKNSASANIQHIKSRFKKMCRSSQRAVLGCTQQKLSEEEKALKEKHKLHFPNWTEVASRSQTPDQPIAFARAHLKFKPETIDRPTVEKELSRITPLTDSVLGYQRDINQSLEKVIKQNVSACYQADIREDDFFDLLVIQATYLVLSGDENRARQLLTDSKSIYEKDFIIYQLQNARYDLHRELKLEKKDDPR